MSDHAHTCDKYNVYSIDIFFNTSKDIDQRKKEVQVGLREIRYRGCGSGLERLFLCRDGYTDEQLAGHNSPATPHEKPAIRYHTINNRAKLSGHNRL